ncbi:MAG: hypothetical protein JNN07_25290 [Verrucomicrobiales bacterium]|nr:hypothetical protein [Verrucomicrobiales bacterium]
MSTPPTPDPLAQIKELLFRGEKIEAIKLFREHMKCGLAEAKSAVDKLESELRAQYPERFTAADKKGCLGVLIFGGIVAGILTAGVWRVGPF